MISKATLRYIRISPRKVRPVIALVKGKRVEDAIATLYSVKRKASGLLIDVIKSAVANAERLGGIDASSLYVSSLIANGGPQLKRFRAASMGRASTIRKRTSHITVELDVRSENQARRPAASQASEIAKIKRADVSVKKGSKEPIKAAHGKKGKE